MQKKAVLSAVILAAALVSGARAQDTTVVTPTTPAPAVQAPAQPAPATVAAPQVAPAPNQVIYAPRLPSANELTSVAAAQGLSVEQINQTATQVTVIYRNASGVTNTVAYQLLPSATAPAATTVVAPAPAPTVIYQSAPQVIYYDSYDYYRPRYYYNPPVSLHFGFGYSNFRHHHHRGRHW